FFSSRRRHTRSKRDWSSDVCSSDLTFCASNLYQTVKGLDPFRRFFRIFTGCVVGQTTSGVIALFSCTHSDLFLVLPMFCHTVFLAHSIVGVLLCVALKGSQRDPTPGCRACPQFADPFS